MANKKYNLATLDRERQNWQQPIPGSYDVSVYSTYLLKKQAVDMYIDGMPVKQIETATGIHSSKLCKMVADCLKPSVNGNVAGYCGLIKSPKKSSGDNRQNKREFQTLLDNYPQLKDFISGNYFGDKKYTTEKNMNIKTLHTRFLAECLRIGVMQHEYPFNTANKGYVSLCSYIHQLEEQNTRLQAKRLDKDSSQKLASTGYGERFSTNALYPFSLVQIDGHIIDMIYTVEILNDDGTVGRLAATRAWLIAVIDVSTRCILGYTLSQEFNYDQYDVMDAIKDAIVPKELKKLTIKGLAYPSNGGFYSTALPELKYVLFDSIMLDNAKSHLSSYVLGKLTNDLKCAVNYGSVATPETRGIIERFFGTLESTGFHKLPMTTGSSSGDLKRKYPEKAAVKYEVTYDQIVELMDVLIARYNNSPHKGLDNLSPLQCMQLKISKAGMMPYTLPKETACQKTDKLGWRMDERVVRGHVKNGKRPYIQFMGAEYRSRLLSSSGQYVGEKIRIVYDPRDISKIEAYTEEGIFIDTLVARGEFGTKSHSVKTRKNVLKLARERGREHLEFDTPIVAYMEHLKEESKKSRRKATRSDIVRRETGSVTPAEAAEKKNNIIELEKFVDSGKKLTSQDVKDLTDNELYDILFKERS